MNSASTNHQPGRLIVVSATHPGRSGKSNEDSFAVFAAWLDDSAGERAALPIQVVVVADGIGGSVAGKEASALAVAAVQKVFEEKPQLPIHERLESAIQQANERIYQTTRQQPELAGMGTTIVIAALVQERLYVAYVGDSRAYLVRNGIAHQLTIDHTWAQEAIDAEVLTPQQAAKHPNRHVIKRYLGVPATVQVEHMLVEPVLSLPGLPPQNLRQLVNTLTLQPGDTLLLCSDGLHDVVNDGQIQTTLLANPPEQAADKLIDLANTAGGPDNITVIVVQWPVLPMARRTIPLTTGIAVAVALLVLVGVAWLLLGQQSNPPANAPPAPTATASVTVPPTPTSTLTHTPTPTFTPSATTVLQILSTLLPTPTPSPTRRPPTATPPATSSPTPTEPLSPAAKETTVLVATITVTATVSALPANDPPSVTTSISNTHPLSSTIAKPELVPSFNLSAKLGEPVKFQWQWNGKLQPNWGFEVRIWSAQTQSYNGVHDAAESAKLLDYSDGIYSLLIDVNKAEGLYEWVVAVVQLNPYAPIGLESAPGQLSVSQ